MKRLKTTLLLALGLTSVTVCLAMAAYLIGLIPDGRRAELQTRAKVAEALAVQLAGAINRSDKAVVETTIDTVVKRNSDIKSVAFRRKDGSILVSQGNHSKHWISPPDGKSTPRHVVVPLMGKDGIQGHIELTFERLKAGNRILGMPASLFWFLGFLATTGFLAFSLFLRRALNELDPSRFISERVQKAFDTLSEGVIIVDEQERIMLVNSAFVQIFGNENQLEPGSKINALAWRMIDGNGIAGEYPWHAALREGRETRDGLISLRTPTGLVKNLNVNATVFKGDKDKTIGAIVTLNDTTNATQNARQLSGAIKQLEATREEVKRQKQELDFLSNHDALTGCLNRRTFMARFEPKLELEQLAGRAVNVLVADIDQLQHIKSQFGPAISDMLYKIAAQSLQTVLPATALVARGGGDGFWVAEFGSHEARVNKMTAEIQASFSRNVSAALPQVGRRH